MKKGSDFETDLLLVTYIFTAFIVLVIGITNESPVACAVSSVLAFIGMKISQEQLEDLENDERED